MQMLLSICRGMTDGETSVKYVVVFHLHKWTNMVFNKLYLMGKSNDAIVEAHLKGYRIDEDGVLYNPKGVVVEGFIDKYNRNYKMFSYKLNGESINIKFHRFVAYQKYGNLIFDSELHVRHLNNDSLDNSFKNIGIGTAKDNSNDRENKDLLKYAINASRANQNQNRSLKKREDIYKMLNQGMSYNKIIEKTDITSKGTLSYMKNFSIEYKEYIKKLNTKK